MIDTLQATWLILFSVGVLAQLVTPMRRQTKAANQTAGLMSLILLGSSIPAALVGFEPKQALAVTALAIYLVINASILLGWKFHPLRTVSQVVANNFRLVAILAGYLALDSTGVINTTNLVLLSLVFTIVLYVRVETWVGRTKFGRLESSTNKTQPTVSLGVPARNETHALSQHLKSTTKSDYGKLELLVVDDCSQDDTAQIIRSFAHSGVRFLKGHDPASATWMGKNGAYQLLEEEASGEIIIFSGVDTRYESHTIDSIVGYMELHKLDMVSIMPSHQKLNPWSMITQPFRYLLMFARGTAKNPPVLSTVWAIRAKKLVKLGGFASVESAIQPERHFAAQLAKKSKYRFLIAGTTLGLTTYKKASSQRETAVRYLYPLLQKSIALQLIFVTALCMALVLPMILIGEALVNDWSIVSSMGLAAFLLGLLSYWRVLETTYPRQALAASPIYYVVGVFALLYLTYQSMLMYERDEVIWKGRNICLPVMARTKSRHADR